MDVRKISDYFDCAPVFKIPGRIFPVEINYARTAHPDYLDSAIETVLMIHVTQPCGDGDILLNFSSLSMRKLKQLSACLLSEQEG